MRQVALVTGGTRGIGSGIAQALAIEGCDLALCGRRPLDEVEEVLAELRAHGVKVIYCRADIGNAEERARMLDEIKKNFGRLDVLVNNAGIAPSKRDDILEASDESFDKLIAVNLKGPHFLTQSVANWMIGRKKAGDDFKGCIINIASVSSTTASINRGDYCLTKAALSMSTKLWATRLAEFGINVYEIRPGIIKTDMTAGVIAKYDKLIDEGMLLQPRWGLPEDVGKAAAMLVRGDLAYSTGQVLMVDGGFSVQRL